MTKEQAFATLKERAPAHAWDMEMIGEVLQDFPDAPHTFLIGEIAAWARGQDRMKDPNRLVRTWFGNWMRKNPALDPHDEDVIVCAMCGTPYNLQRRLQEGERAWSWCRVCQNRLDELDAEGVEPFDAMNIRKQEVRDARSKREG